MKTAMSEAAWAAQVEDLALLSGFRVYRVTNSTREIVRRSGARVRVRNVNASGVGFPDMVLVHARRKLLLFVELKRGKQRGHHHGVTEAQDAWLTDLRAVAEVAGASIGVFVWTPADWSDVVSTLTGEGNDMTDTELRAIAEKATPGPWREFTEQTWHKIDAADGSGIALMNVFGRHREATDDARHIAAWHPARALAALDVIEAAMAWRHVPDFSARCPFCDTEEWPHTEYRGTPCPIGALCEALDRWQALEETP